MSKQTVRLGDVVYDAKSGLPVPAAKPAASRGVKPSAGTVHRHTQRSKTLRRGHMAPPSAKTARRPGVQRVHSVAKSPMISRFAPDITPPKRPATPAAKAKAASRDIGPVKHPLEHKVEARQAAKKPATVQTRMAAEMKQQAIREALKRSTPQHKAPAVVSSSRRSGRIFSIAAASLAVLLLAGYLTYINMPTLSVRVAAMQAGIDASYPAYHPDGYSLNGPVAYADGEVSMKFASNTGPQSFVVNETRSQWDSSALLDNYVTAQSNGDYLTIHDSGLTIYVYDADAAWVNGGILYTVSGDAPLSTDQLRHIATSM